GWDADPGGRTVGHRPPRVPRPQLLVTAGAARYRPGHRRPAVAPPGGRHDDADAPAHRERPAAPARLGRADRGRRAAAGAGPGRQPTADAVRPGRAARCGLVRRLVST